jgi:hypothetical protein
MHWEILDAEGMIILKSIVKKYAGMVLAGLIRIRIDISGGLSYKIKLN